MKTKAKTNYRIRNWKEYNAALKQRGSITFWVDEMVIEQWNNTKKTGKRGASNHYSDKRNCNDGNGKKPVSSRWTTNGRICGVVVYSNGH